MDVVGSISGLQQAKVLSKIQFSVARKVLDMQQMQGSAALELIQAATEGMTKAGDQLVAAATGLGGEIDTYA
jgi:hypothetical protein